MTVQINNNNSEGFWVNDPDDPLYFYVNVCFTLISFYVYILWLLLIIKDF